MRSLKLANVLTLVTLTSCDFLSGSGLGTIARETLYFIPESFSCSKQGFEEFQGVIDDHVLQENDGWFSSGKDPDSDVGGSIYRYLKDFNQTLQAKCDAAFPGIYNYCMRFKKVNPIGETEGQVNQDKFTISIHYRLTGPIETFGIYSAQVEVREIIGGNLLYINHRNSVEDTLDRDERDDGYPGNDWDYLNQKRCFNKAIEDYHTRTYRGENYYASPQQSWNK